jgi:hypothetical protein
MSENPTAAGDAGEAKPAFSSSLKEGRQRFLAHAVEHSLEIGRRSADDFIRHFPPETIMKGLEHQAGLRASILVLTTGLKKKIAMKKSWESAAEDLQIALDEGETDAESIVAVFEPDDRIRYLDNKKIWSFLVEGEFWTAREGDKAALDAARSHIAFMLDRALVDHLLSHRNVVDGITVAELAQRLPKKELGVIIESALESAHDKKPFTERDLLAARPPSVLVDYVPLPHLWDNVIAPKIAEAHGYVEPPPPPAAEEAATDEAAPEAATVTAQEPAPQSQEWVNVSNSEMPPPGDDDDEDEVSDEDFASP